MPWRISPLPRTSCNDIKSPAWLIFNGSILNGTNSFQCQAGCGYALIISFPAKVTGLGQPLAAFSRQSVQRTKKSFMGCLTPFLHRSQSDVDSRTWNINQTDF